VAPRGAGEPWVRALLAEVDLVADDEVLTGTGRSRVGASGILRDQYGVVRLGNPSGGGGILERRDELARLVRDEEAARKGADSARADREAARSALQEAELQAEASRTALRGAEDALRKVESEVAAAQERRQRMDQHHAELARQVEATEAGIAQARARQVKARDDREALQARESALTAQRAEARGLVDQVQQQWEAARGEQAELEVRFTRLQGEVARLDERKTLAQRARDAAHQRIEALDTEEKRLGSELEQVSALQAEGAERTATLFGQRDEAEVELRGRDERLNEVGEALATAERAARQARVAEREATDRRHRLELERQELQGRIDRIQDRLEAEWGRSVDQLFAEANDVEGEPETLTEELREIVVALERIGPVNMLAVEEHAEESERLAFLTEQHDDLIKARDDLRSAIREINETATTLFNETFDRIREHFKSVHQRLFEGGEADIWLSEDDDVLESAIEIHASPRGKKTQRIDLLSGGERALTALSLLFAIYLVKPSPFCVLDEVDAPLDENNIGRFIRLLHDFKEHTQFVVITHNPRTIEASDWIYGVTMEEPGVSTIVGVRLEEALEQARGSAGAST
jgi:chromosome segregation protein